MLLHELHLDILDIIISFVSEISVDDLHSLALTSHTLHEVSSSYIVRRLYFRISSERFELFERSLRARPAYGLGVRSLQLHSNFTGNYTPSVPYAFLQNVPLLQSLWTDDKGVTGNLLSGSLSICQSLLDVTLHVGDMTATMVLQLASLPQVRRLSIQGLKGQEIAEITHETMEKIELRSLDLRGSQIGHRVLQEILRRSYALDKLQCNVPLLKDFPRSPFGGSTFHIPYSLSPRQIGTCFTSIAHTLTELNLGNQLLHWQGHHGSRLDLSSLVKLRVLSIAALCILAPLPMRMSRDSLYKLLPHSLEKLSVSYDFALDHGHTSTNCLIRHRSNFAFALAFSTRQSMVLAR